MNRTMLLRLARKYGHWDGTDEDLDDAVTLAEARIGRDLRSAWNNTAAAMKLDVGKEYAELPADFRTFEAAWDTHTDEEWRLRDRRALQEAETGRRADRVCVVGLQPFLSVDSLIMQFYPLPVEFDWDSDGILYRRVTLWYWGQPAVLTDAPRASHPATVFPDAYVHGTLMEVARLSNDAAALERAAVEYGTAIDLANLTVTGTETDTGTSMPDLIIGG